MTRETSLEREAKLAGNAATWGLTPAVLESVLDYHSLLSFEQGAMIFRVGAPAEFLLCLVKGVAKVYCPSPNGSGILVRYARQGEIIGYADKLNDRGQWVRRFEAFAVSKCSVAMISRGHLNRVLSALPPATLLNLLQKLNAWWSEQAEQQARFLCLSFRERLEYVFQDLATRFGADDVSGSLLTVSPSHADFAEMIGSSRAMVSRLTAEMIDEGLIARRGKQYVVVRGSCLMPEVPEQETAEIGAPLVSRPRGRSIRSAA